MTEDEPADLSHLHEAARRIARLPDEERLRYVRADRWIGYPRAAAALDRLETLLAWPAKARMPNLLLIGPTNNGKSMIVEKFWRTHPPISHPDREEIPVLTVQMPSEPSVGRFYTAMLTALGAPLRPRQRLAELEQPALTLLRQVGVRMLVIDELHNVLAGRGDTRREFLNLLRFLGNELRIPLVGVGTRDAYLAIRTDDQLENRFAPLTLPRWEPDDDSRSLLASLRCSRRSASAPACRRARCG
nr:TniB family NTP-binding protein [Frankia sp. Cas3]